MLVLDEMRTGDTEAVEQTAALEAAVFPDPWSCREIEKTVEQAHTLCGIAREGVKVCGYFLCYYVLDECEIARIAVTQQERNRGIGKQLLCFMEELCRQKGITKLMLDVRESNQIAISFYERNGFVVDGVRKHFYGGSNPEDAILMSRLLTDEKGI